MPEKERERDGTRIFRYMRRSFYYAAIRLGDANVARCYILYVVVTYAHVRSVFSIFANESRTLKSTYRRIFAREMSNLLQAKLFRTTVVNVSEDYCGFCYEFSRMLFAFHNENSAGDQREKDRKVEVIR